MAAQIQREILYFLLDLQQSGHVLKKLQLNDMNAAQLCACQEALGTAKNSFSLTKWLMMRTASFSWERNGSACLECGDDEPAVAHSCKVDTLFLITVEKKSRNHF